MKVGSDKAQTRVLEVVTPGSNKSNQANEAIEDTKSFSRDRHGSGLGYSRMQRIEMTRGDLVHGCV